MVDFCDRFKAIGSVKNRSVLFVSFVSLVLMTGLASSCATVKVQAPDEPIEINLNVKIEQEVLIKLDKEIDDLISENPDIF